MDQIISSGGMRDWPAEELAAARVLEPAAVDPRDPVPGIKDQVDDVIAEVRLDPPVREGQLRL